MAIASNFNARNADAYELSMGRWSRRLAVGFTAFAGLAPGERVLDVGCGTGSLTFHLAEGGAVVSGIDASPIYVAAAQERIGDARVTVAEGDACAIDCPDASFDRALSQLVLQFVPEPARAVREMCRVVRPGGVVAAAIWASSSGYVHQRMLLDTAAMIDPAAAALRAHTFTRPLTRRGELAALWAQAGLADVREDAVTIWMEFADFADYWAPLVAGEGTMGRYVSALAPGPLAVLEGHMRAAYESGAPDGPRSFAATALVCRGVRV